MVAWLLFGVPAVSIYVSVILLAHPPRDANVDNQGNAQLVGLLGIIFSLLVFIVVSAYHGLHS